MSRQRIGSTVAIIAPGLAVLALAGGVALGATPAPYHPRIVPSQFTDTITNPYLPLTKGTVHRYGGTKDGVPIQTTVTVTPRTRTIMGVRTVVVTDLVTQNHSLVEKTTDWYAQDVAGSVWYFGEDTAEYSNGVVVSTAGTWEAGVDGAQPGIVMPARPTVGITYRQEYRPKVALDTAKVLQTDAVRTVPAGTFRHLVVTFDRNPLDPSKKERKWYASGVGLVYANLHGGGHTQITKLIK